MRVSPNRKEKIHAAFSLRANKRFVFWCSLV
jgi:hypothetical protein